MEGLLCNELSTIEIGFPGLCETALRFWVLSELIKSVASRMTEDEFHLRLLQ